MRPPSLNTLLSYPYWKKEPSWLWASNSSWNTSSCYPNLTKPPLQTAVLIPKTETNGPTKHLKRIKCLIRVQTKISQTKWQATTSHRESSTKSKNFKPNLEVKNAIFLPNFASLLPNLTKPHLQNGLLKPKTTIRNPKLFPHKKLNCYPISKNF